MVAVCNFPSPSNSGYVYVAGQGDGQVYAAWSANSGVTWTTPQALGSGFSSDIAIRPNGTVCVFYSVSVANAGTFQNTIKYRWLRPGQTNWNGPDAVSAHADNNGFFYSTKFYASGDPKRYKNANEDDYFVSNGFPRVCVSRDTGRIYLVYADLPYVGSTTDRSDVYVQEAQTANPDGSLTGRWSGAIRVNNDATATDQWNPSVAVNPAGTRLFIGYYSRQNRPADNDLIQAYGAKANISSGLVGATFDQFPIRTTAFPPLFPGTTTSTPPQNTWMYDHVWAQRDVWLDTSAKVTTDPSRYYELTAFTYQHFMADDYTWASADDTYFYFAWCDRSDPCYFGGNSRPDPNIRLGKLLQ